MNRAIGDSDRAIDQHPYLDAVLLGALLVTLGIAWAAAGLMIVAAVLTLVMSAPSLLVFVSVSLAVIVAARAATRIMTTNRHRPHPGT